MSNNNSTVSLTLQLKGQQASQEMKKFTDQQISATKQINQQWEKVGKSQAISNEIAKKTTGELVKQGQALGTQTKEAMAIEAARKLGLRTEQQIKNEIKQTHSTYAQLSVLQRQGVVTAKDMERAYASMNNKVSQLNRELGKTVVAEKQIQQLQKSNGGSGLLQKGTMVGGAVVGAGYMLQRPVRDAMQYEKDLAQLSITAYDNPNDRKFGQNTLRSIITSTAKKYGQSTDDVFTGLNSLVASGKYKGKTNTETEKNLSTALGAAAEAAQASGGDILDFAQLSVAAKVKHIPEREYMAYAVQAGKEGNFETRDLAKHLATQSGMLPSDPANKNRQASQLMALNQVAMTTAGTPDQAGNNVTNLLSKMNAQSTKKTFKKDYGIDLDKEYLKGAATGKTSFDVFGEALSKAMNQDSRYKKLLSDLKKVGNSDERQQILLSQQGILEQSALSNILPDMQALAGGVALVTQWQEFQRITKVNQDKGLQSLTEDSATMRDTSSYGVNQLTVTKKNSEFDALNGFNNVIGDTSTRLSDYAEKYPALATAVAGTTVAIAALGTAAGITTLAMGKNVPLPAGSATGAVTSKASNIAKTAGVAAAGYVGYELFKPLDDFFYGKIAGLFGASEERPDFLQMAIDKSQEQKEVLEQQNQLIEKQNQISADMASKLNSLISVTQQNKPVINMGGSLMDQISQHARTEEKRHGVSLLTYGQN